MKTKFITSKINYDGSQLHALYAYLNHKLHGDSMIAFTGGCNISFANMVDAEDVVAQAKIAGDEMLHFIIEIFNQNLMTAVSLQRLLASIALSIINSSSSIAVTNPLTRSGDDLYMSLKGKAHKLSISIASISAVSAMIHFAVNLTNDGTPVKTCSLQDLKLKSKEFANALMKQFSEEYISIVEATQKVKPLS